MPNNDVPDISSPAAMSFRVLMRAQGVAPPKRRSGRPKRRAEPCVRCGLVDHLSVDHIVPQARLRDTQEVRDHPANKQMMCNNIVRAHARPDADGRTRYWVERTGCNESKGDGPAVDYRPDRQLHEQLLDLLDQFGIAEPVEWNPLPWHPRAHLLRTSA